MTVSAKPSCNRPNRPRHGQRAGATLDEIEPLLWWTYQAQYAHVLQVDDDLRVTMRALAGVGGMGGAFDMWSQLGTLVDGRSGGFEVHPDAEAVHDQVLALDSVARGLVVMHANGGTQPDWMEDERMRALPVLRGNGSPLVEYDQNKRPSMCPIRYDPPPGHIEFARGVWVRWWDGVQAVADSLSARWGRRVVGLTVPRQPWSPGMPVDSAEKV